MLADAGIASRRASEDLVEEGAVTVGGARIRYSAWGEPDHRGVLFVHGGRAHRNWWRPFAPFFAENRRVAALDLSGMGDSDWREKYSLDLLVDELNHFIGINIDHMVMVIIGHQLKNRMTSLKLMP